MADLSLPPKGEQRRVRIFVGSIWAFGGMLALLLLMADRLGSGGRSPLKIAGIDSVCYFSVAHSLLFDHDLDLANEYTALRAVDSRWLETTAATGRRGSPFPIGMSLLELPFLAVGEGVARLGGAQRGGYSRPAIAAYFVGLVVFLCVGLTASYRFLAELGRTWHPSARRADWVAYLVTVGLWPATTLAYYTVSPMAHVPAFMAASLFVLSWWRARGGDQGRRWVLVGAALGLLFLCRWQGILFGLVPVIDDLVRLRRSPGPNRQMSIARLTALGALLLVMVPQFAEWRVIYGAWLTVPQGDAFLQFPPRHSLHVLFSTRHGWFVWTPIGLVGVAGLVGASFRGNWIARAFLAVIAAEVMLIGALVHAWSGHEAFGMRFLTDCAGLVGVGVLWLALRTRRAAVAVAVAGIACTLWTLVFAAQYRLDLLPRDDRLTAQELLFDKFHLRGAIKRHRIAGQVSDLIDQGDYPQALEILAKVPQQPLDREWTAVDVRLREAVADSDGLKAAQARRRAFELRQLP